jgi:hypothetical protein
MTPEDRISELEEILKRYEENGIAKLYYALNRKAWEMADMLNGINLKTVPLDDPKDKTFDRLRYIINDSSSTAQAVKELGSIAGITGDEKKDVEKKPFNDRLAESRT